MWDGCSLSILGAKEIFSPLNHLITKKEGTTIQKADLT